jgi:hypothetical protein
MNALHATMSLLLAVLSTGAAAQEHPFLVVYEVTEIDGAIQVEWVMQGGNTCNGQDVERSSNGTEFASVFHIEGICGDANIAVPYRFIDRTPPELSIVYYRIKLGFDGYSSVKTVLYTQLNTTDQRFYPSPMREAATLVLRVPVATPIDLRIWDAGGRLVHERIKVPGPSVEIRIPDLASGAYSYQAIADGRTFNGRFQKE